MLRSEFELLRLAEADGLDSFSGKLSGMAAPFTGLGTMLEDAVMVKKLLDTVPNRLYAAVAGIEQFCDVEMMVFEEAMGRIKACKEQTWRRA